MRQTATADVRLDESKAGSFSDRAPSIAGSISFACGDGELPLPKSFNGAILVPRVPIRRMLAQVSTARDRNASSTGGRVWRSFRSVKTVHLMPEATAAKGSLIRRRDDGAAEPGIGRPPRVGRIRS
jgi:hypothetical protein